MCFPKIIVVGVAALCGVASFSVSLAETDFFLRGDVDGSSRLEMRDVLSVLRFLFLEGEEPSCLDAADSNDDGKLDLSDAIYVLGHLFLGGPAPPAPFPKAGVDPTPDELDCGRNR